MAFRVGRLSCLSVYLCFLGLGGAVARAGSSDCFDLVLTWGLGFDFDLRADGLWRFGRVFCCLGVGREILDLDLEGVVDLRALLDGLFGFEGRVGAIIEGVR